MVHINEEGLEGHSPSHGFSHTDVMKTQALRQALDKYKYDAAFGGARRDEEKSRAKERIFSFRDRSHPGIPEAAPGAVEPVQRPPQGESIRVFPLSNWTELGHLVYIYAEQIPVVPLYFAKERPVVARDRTWIMVDDERLPLQAGETTPDEAVRFRTLGCYPLTGASQRATTLPDIIREMLVTKRPSARPAHRSR